ncbi:endo-1,4-beta xylanase [Trametes versicolor FP-101664 SS1]|uniref:endo-1,4-beta xylanase n=1 Tax=Trametes versicolor (strain FP-101664) TaxID=717944 RepID=UPI000462250A|nr:endo-1,4-beta xylanase [Trametes versicolor FP-101664 SS1]EIW54190.1 endo-1,4-beta xylanase [Trametes versicolor FP-101664 SS1]
MLSLSKGLLALSILLRGAFALPASDASSALFPISGLNLAAKSARKLYLGTATNSEQWNDTTYLNILKSNAEFGQVTPANVMKWFATEPEEGVFTFQDGDIIADFTEKTGKLLRGHNCVWHNQLPDWLETGTFSAPELAFIVSRHCFNLVNHYQGHVYSWDVINEAFNDDGTFRSDIFFNTLNTTYIPLALYAARAADPKAKLYINDFNIEGIGAKSDALKSLIKDLKSQNVPIDGVGLQSHFEVGGVPPTLQQNMEEFVALGLEVAITELDIRFTALPPTAAGIAQQKADYETVVAACNAVPKCVGVTLWDFTDKYSWIPGTFPGQGDACPWTDEFVKRPAYQGIIEGFKTHH